ncbi:MAG: hypothetical protein LBB60_03475 [Desulfovibrio sp.]|jgi:hypothetical protein|nr:hypothetical protein [Desulfovibrio sp.]
MKSALSLLLALTLLGGACAVAAESAPAGDSSRQAAAVKQNAAAPAKDAPSRLEAAIRQAVNAKKKLTKRQNPDFSASPALRLSALCCPCSGPCG